ncbi:hypothetical protein OTU49_010405 [Cherax quadricarinatus]|uniref:SAM domain-containing protein n=1 Tax=Cherax quadricarinatus TaxID=27406 RepID=A0AAW0W974_CHEQU
MDHRTSTLSPSSVIEVVIEGTLEFDVTFETRVRPQIQPPEPRDNSRIFFGQGNLAGKVRPVATIRPLPEKENLKESETESPEIPDDIKKTELIESFQDSELQEALSILDDDSSGDWKTTEFNTTQQENYNNTNEALCVIQQSDSTLPEESDPVKKEKEVVEANEQSHTQYDFVRKEPTNLGNSCCVETNQSFSEQGPKQVSDPCCCHRDWVRAQSAKSNTKLNTRYHSTKKMEGEYQEGCHNGECEENQGCDTRESFEVEKQVHHKELPITECLDEFLEKLHLSHLADYLRVLGCTCVRDLRLLEKPELEAIQLISRRRLLQELDSFNLHHEAPPADCSLEGWLTWYGLTHIAGFLKAIGVHSVADMTYLREEDLQLLKPVTRRRILACYRKSA